MGRPIDTENIITNRHRIRFTAAMNLFLALTYLAIKPLFIRPNISWIHYLHFVFQPLILFASITEITYIVVIASYISIVLFCSDAAVVVISGISVSRCYLEPTAWCLGRLYENGVWALLGVFFCLFNLIAFLQSQNLSKQLEEKDVKEAEINELLKIRKIAPKFNKLKINAHKIHSLHLFLIVQDIIYVAITLAKTFTNPIYWLSVGHIVLDPYIVYLGKSENKSFYDMARIVYILFLLGDGALFVLNLELNSRDVAEWLAFLFILVYISLDIILIALSSEIITDHLNLKKMKSSI